MHREAVAGDPLQWQLVVVHLGPQNIPKNATTTKTNTD